EVSPSTHAPREMPTAEGRAVTTSARHVRSPLSARKESLIQTLPQLDTSAKHLFKMIHLTRKNGVDERVNLNGDPMKLPRWYVSSPHKVGAFGLERPYGVRHAREPGAAFTE